MCLPAVLAPLLGTGAAAAGGATAAGATALASTLQTIGTAVSVGGAVMQGVQGAQAAGMQARALKDQAKTEAALLAEQDGRQRSRFLSAIRQQRAELMARGVTLDSPTSIALGQAAAAEMSFESQALRSAGAARQTELSWAQKAARMQGASSLLRGFSSAAGTLLQAAPDLWPGFMRDPVEG
jgi:hypothetical protein